MKRAAKNFFTHFLVGQSDYILTTCFSEMAMLTAFWDFDCMKSHFDCNAVGTNLADKLENFGYSHFVFYYNFLIIFFIFFTIFFNF